MELIKQTPQFDQQSAATIAHELYGLTVTATPLVSERDQNFRLTTSDGKAFVLKIANALEDAGFLEAQAQIMDHLSTAGLDFCPQIIPTLSGEKTAEVSGQNQTSHAVRLVTYLPGKPLGKTTWHSERLMRDFGRKLGQMDGALTDFDHPAAHHTFHWDLAEGLNIVAKHRHLVTDPVKAAAIDHFMGEIERNLLPLLPGLRRSVIHNDANDYNVIADEKSQTITGIIDFGDMVHSYTVGNLAIGAAYMLLERADPVGHVAPMIAGYNAAFELTDDELAALWGLMLLRISVSICMAAVQLAERPDDPYLAISQQPIANTLDALLATPYRMATAIFRHACGREPFPQSSRIISWLQNQAFSPVLGRDLAAEATLTLDLSVGSPLLPGDIANNHEPGMTRRPFLSGWRPIT